MNQHHQQHPQVALGLDCQGNPPAAGGTEGVMENARKVVEITKVAHAQQTKTGL